MMGHDRVTTGDICRLFGVHGWQARRAVDSLGEEKIMRAGRYRLVSREHLKQVEVELRRRGYLR